MNKYYPQTLSIIRNKDEIGMLTSINAKYFTFQNKYEYTIEYFCFKSSFLSIATFPIISIVMYYEKGFS